MTLTLCLPGPCEVVSLWRVHPQHSLRPSLLSWQVLYTCPGLLCTCPPLCPSWVPPAPWPENEQGQVKFSRQERDQSDGLEWCLRQAAHPQPHRLANIQQTKSCPFHLWPLLKMHGKKSILQNLDLEPRSVGQFSISRQVSAIPWPRALSY